MKAILQSSNVDHGFGNNTVEDSQRIVGTPSGTSSAQVGTAQRRRAETFAALPRLNITTRIMQQRRMAPSSHRTGRLSATEPSTSSGTGAGAAPFKSQRANELASSGKRLKLKKWRPADRFQISSESDSVVNRGARVQAADHGIPSRNRFSMDLTIPQSSARALVERPLQRLTLESRLDIHAHGDEDSVEDLTAAQLAKKLHDAGLQEVGVIKIQACNAGKGNYLRELLAQLDNKGVKVGYLCGPKGLLAETRDVEDLGDGEQYVTKDLSCLPGKLVGWLPETFRLNVVKGNVDVAFSGTRYNLSR